METELSDGITRYPTQQHHCQDKGTPDRKEKDSRKLCAKTTHGPSKEAVKRPVNQ
jgi:hypothetical protein